jgi:hypothetical protein
MHAAGTFDAVVIEHGFSSAKTGTPQFWARFETQECEIIGYFALTDKSAEYTIEKIKAMGYNGADLGELAEGNILAGHEVRITVEHSEYNGRMSAKVAFVNPCGDAPTQQRDASAAAKARMFNALLGKPTKQQAPKPSSEPEDLPPF